MPSLRAAPEQLRQWFDAIDIDRNGHLTATELQRALALGGLTFALSTVAHIIRNHDRDNSGTITYDEFERLHEFLRSVQASFEYFDKDRSGTLSYDEIRQALQNAGYNVDGPALTTVFARFDPERKAALSLTEYLALTLFIRSATATFNAFDNQRTGFIRINFNQFLYACANTI